MQTETLNLIVAACGVIASAAIGGLAIVIARASYKASERQTQAAERQTTVEERRWWVEQTPRFKVEPELAGGEAVRLWVVFDGPDGLGQLDRVSATIRNDRRERKAGIAGGPTQAEIDAQIWGPLRFRAGIDDVVDERTAETTNLLPGDRWALFLEPTVAPPWHTDPAAWRAQYADAPVQLLLRCIREGYDPWTVRVDVSLIRSPLMAGG